MAGIKEIFGRNITHWLESEGRKQRWLASKLDLNESVVLRWKTGETFPRDLELLSRLADLIGVPVPLLFVEDGVADPEGAWDRVKDELR